MRYFPLPQARGSHQRDPIRRLGRHQISRDCAVTEDIGRILLEVHVTVAYKDGKALDFRGIILKGNTSVKFGLGFFYDSSHIIIVTFRFQTVDYLLKEVIIYKITSLS